MRFATRWSRPHLAKSDVVLRRRADICLRPCDPLTHPKSVMSPFSPPIDVRPVSKALDMNEEVFRFDEIGPLTREQVQSILGNRDLCELSKLAISVSMFESDRLFAEELCVRLAGHDDTTVRGNAILGLGHIARRFRMLATVQCKAILEAALKDDSEYVRGQAWAAADDVTHFLNWQLDGFDN